MNENLEAPGFKLLIKGPIKNAGATSLLEVRKERIILYITNFLLITTIDKVRKC